MRQSPLTGTGPVREGRSPAPRGRRRGDCSAPPRFKWTERRGLVSRFLTADRFEASAGDFNLQSDPLTQSRYAFAGGNPVSNVEWDGHTNESDGDPTRDAGPQVPKARAKKFKRWEAWQAERNSDSDAASGDGHRKQAESKPASMAVTPFGEFPRKDAGGGGSELRDVTNLVFQRGTLQGEFKASMEFHLANYRDLREGDTDAVKDRVKLAALEAATQRVGGRIARSGPVRKLAERLGLSAGRTTDKPGAAPKRNGGESNAAAYGRRMHKDWDYGPGFRKEVTLDSGRRPDAINRRTPEVVELKPNRPGAIRRGQRQLEIYKRDLERQFGGTWRTRLVTYDPY